MKRNDSRSFGPKYEHPHSCRVFFDENANRCFSQRLEVKIKIKYRKQIRTDTIEIYTFCMCIVFVHGSRYYGIITIVVNMRRLGMDGSPSHWIFFFRLSVVYSWTIYYPWAYWWFVANDVFKNQYKSTSDHFYKNWFRSVKYTAH